MPVGGSPFWLAGSSTSTSPIPRQEQGLQGGRTGRLRRWLSQPSVGGPISSEAGRSIHTPSQSGPEIQYLYVGVPLRSKLPGFPSAIHVSLLHRARDTGGFEPPLSERLGAVPRPLLLGSRLAARGHRWQRGGLQHHFVSQQADSLDPLWGPAFKRR